MTPTLQKYNEMKNVEGCCVCVCEIEANRSSSNNINRCATIQFIREIITNEF